MHLSTSFFYRWLTSIKKASSSKGFTLLELLISLVIAGMVMSGLLYVVVELTQIDKRESSLDQVQRDMQRAMDYIVDDLQEAVYVYPADELTAVINQLETDSGYPQGSNVVPVLAFWRVDPIGNLPDCTSFSANEEKERLCEVLSIRQASYTLVVYSQRQNDATNSNWSGQSQIVRSELSRYSAAGLKTLTERDGYRDPTKQNDGDAGFEGWKVALSSSGGSAEIPDTESAVLVDFVQAPNVGTLNRAPLSDLNGGANTPCYSFGVQPNEDSTKPDIPLYSVVPANATTTTNNSFFACVRDPDPSDNTAARANQDVYVFLRGSTQGISGGVTSFSDESSLPTLETRVLVRGVIDKNVR